MPQVPPDPELNDIELALGRLAPAPSRIDRDRLMFEAGARSVRSPSRRGWLWPAVAAGLATVALSESIALAVRPAARVVVVTREPPDRQGQPRTTDPVLVEILVQKPPTTSPDRADWTVGGDPELGLRRQILRFGLEGLPDPPALVMQAEAPATLPESSPGPGAANPGPLRRYELNKVLEMGGPS